MATACGSRVHASGKSDCLATTASPAQKWLASAASSTALGGRAGQRRDLAILARTAEPPLGLLAAIPVRSASLFPQMWYLSLGYGSLRGCVGHFFGQIAHVFGKIGCTRLCTLNFRFYRKTRGSDARAESNPAAAALALCCVAPAFIRLGGGSSPWSKFEAPV